MIDKDAITALTKAESISAATGALAAAANSGFRVAALPDDFEVVDLERFDGVRRRARGVMATTIVADFAAYVAAHREAGATAFVNQDTMTASVVLNLGEPSLPGHADNLAKLETKQTAPFKALLGIANGAGHKQQTVAEFLEDWTAHIQCFNDDGAISSPKAVAAVRKITIEAMRRQESSEQQLSASRSAFESVQASSADPLPHLVYFRCVPYVGLQERLFVARLGVLTSSDKPAITLRVINMEQHQDEMAAELAQIVRDALAEQVPVHVGTYKAAA